MPRYLYLLRHAQSAEKQIGQSDKQRELTSLGVKQSLQVANIFLSEKTFPELIVCSVAERALATASLISDVLKFEPEKISAQDELYEASTRTLLEFISQLDDTLQHVLCVAHNPAISYLAEYLTKSEIGEMAPAGMAIIQFDIDSWKAVSARNGLLLRYIDVNNLN